MCVLAYTLGTHLVLRARLTVLTATKESAPLRQLVDGRWRIFWCYNSPMLLYAQLAILVVLALLNISYGIGQGLYESIWWWDIPAHLLGGVWVGLFAAWVVQLRSGRFSPLYSIGAALGVGIGWELFEHYFSLGHNPHFSYWADTIKDVVMDVVGGALAGYVARVEKIIWQK